MIDSQLTRVGAALVTRRRENAMWGRGSGRRWVRLPSRVALLLGLGALSAAGARADAAESRPGVGDMVIRSDGARIYLAEDGSDFQELQINDPVRLRALQLLIAESGTDAGRDGARLRPLILAGDGGAGFHWAPADNSGRAASQHRQPKLRTPTKGGTPGQPEQPGGPAGAAITGGPRKG